MKRLLLIICLLPVLAFGQFSGAKKLLLQQQGEYCEYGNLADYTTELFVIYGTYSSNCSYSDTQKLASLEEVKQTLDNLRSCGTSMSSTGSGFCKSHAVGNKILRYNVTRDGPVCELSSIVDSWCFGGQQTFPVGATPIFHIENSIITYIEYY